MKRIACILAVFILFSFNRVNAQDYNVGIGLRLGIYVSGITVKGFINERGALEGITGFGRQTLVLTGLYEHHFPLEGVNGLSLYAGGGGHFGFFGHESRYLIYKDKSEKIYVVDKGETVVVPGVDGIVGIEYKFQGAPFTVGADLRPFLDFYEGISAYTDGALNVRFVF